MSDDVARRLARLEAERDVAALMARYARLVDEGPDADAIAELFTADAVYETFGFLGREPGADPIRGREALRATFRDLPQLLSFTAHLLCNPEIEGAADGRSAHGRWLALELANAERTDEGDVGRLALVMVAAYRNDFALDGDTWRLHHVRFGDLRAFAWADGFASTRYVSMYGGGRIDD